jgi:hypothetical protein
MLRTRVAYTFLGTASAALIVISKFVLHKVCPVLKYFAFQQHVRIGLLCSYLTVSITFMFCITIINVLYFRFNHVSEFSNIIFM